MIYHDRFSNNFSVFSNDAYMDFYEDKVWKLSFFYNYSNYNYKIYLFINTSIFCIYIFFSPPENAVRFLLGASSIGALGGLFWLLDRERRIVIIKSVDHETLKEIQGSLQKRERRTKEVLVGCIFFMFLGFLIYLLPH